MATAVLKFTTVPVTSKYGWRTLKLSGVRNLHEGCDTANGSKYPHSAFGDGVVVESPQESKHWKYGWYIRIKHADGIETSHHSLDKRALFKKGQQVRMGQIIGYAGSSAMAASGNHVHNALWLNGKHVDPLKYLTPGVAVTISNTGNLAAGNGATIIDNEEDDMTPEQAKQLNSIYGAIFNGGNSMKDDGKSISQSLAEIRTLTTAPINGRDRGDGKGPQNVSVRQDNADTNTMVRKLVAQVAGLQSALAAVALGRGGDPDAIQEAARAGTAEALKALTFTVEVD